jgi:thiol:disulfide interchange protein
VVLFVAGCAPGAPSTSEPPSPAALASSPSLDPTEPPASPVDVRTMPPPTASAAAAVNLYDPTLDAPAQVDAALAAARADGKHVLIEFGADWCPDCHVLAAYLQDPRSAAILEDSYHVVRVDVGYFDRNLETATRYGNAIAVGIPSVVILDGDGNKLVDTAAGELADSRRYDADDIVDFLAAWQP